MKLYSAEWCSGCKPVKTFIEQNNLQDKVEIINVDKTPEKVPQGLRGIPALETGDVLLSGQLSIMKELKGLV